jgi:ABC-2 type transport system permease protein
VSGTGSRPRGPLVAPAAVRSRAWGRLAALIRKEFRQLLRDRGNLALGIALPMVLIFIFGYGLSLDVRNAPLAVVLEDASPAATEAVSGLQLSPAIAPLLVASMHEATLLLRKGEVDGIVRVPPDFSSGQALGRSRIQLIVHGTDAARAGLVQAYALGALVQPATRASDRAGNAAPAGTGGNGRVTVEERIWFNEANTSTWYLVPGLIVLIMTLVGAFLTALVMAREWESGTLEALFVTPVRPTEILLAKVIPCFCVGLAGLLLCLLAARFLFQVPMRGSLALLLLGSVLYLLVAVGLGLLISAATRNQFLASQVALLATFLPSLMLSGFLFDLRNVPAAVRLIGNLLPATHFMELIKTLFLAGNVWPIVLKDSALLALYAVALLALARVVTRKKLPG